MVHSKEWTTGSYPFPAFDLISDLFQGASGPLDKVDHWLAAFRVFGLVSALFPGASGPLERVVHWLTTFRAFDLVSESSPKSCVKICRLSYSLFAFGEVDQEGARIGLPSIV